MPPTTLTSPRLGALRRRLRAGDRAALDAFWQEVRAHGTPLVEPLRDDDRHALVTFLWQGADVQNTVSTLARPRPVDAHQRVLGLDGAQNPDQVSL